MREVFRRMLLVAGVAGTLCLACWTSLTPLVVVEPVDMAQAQAQGKRFGILERETMGQLRTQPPDAYVARLTRDRAVAAKGPAWETFTKRVARYFADPATAPDWQWRTTRFRYGGRPADLWFRPDEGPLAELGPMLARAGTVFVSMHQGAAGPWLLVERETFSPDQYRPFFGFSGRTPPRAFQYPLLAWAWLPLVLGLLGYAFLPWPKHEETEVYHPIWGLVVTDLVFLLLLFTPFFGLPFFLGGPIQTFSHWWGLALVLWPISCLALWGLRFTAWYGAFGLRIRPQGLTFRIWGRTEEVPFSQIASCTRAELRPPRWMTWLLWLGAMTGRPGMTGQAILQGNASYRGFVLRLRDGREFALWCTNQMGGLVLRHVEGFVSALAAAKVRLRDEIEERRGFGGMDDGFHKPGEPRSRRPSLALMATPLAVFCLALALSALVSAMTPSVKPTRTAEATAKPMEPEVASPPAATATWRVLAGPVDGRANFRALTPLPGGDVLAVGDCDTRATNLDILAAAVSPDGRTRWQAEPKGDFIERVLDKDQDFGWEYGLAGLPGPDGGALLAAESRLQNRTRSQALAIGLDAGGRERWRRTVGDDDCLSTPLGLIPDGRGGAAMVVLDEPGMLAGGRVPRRLRVVRLDKTGRVTGVTPVALDLTGMTLAAMAALPDRGCVLAGTFDNRGPGHLDGLVIRLTASGAVGWRRTIGGPGAERGRGVAVLADGGILLVGETGLAAERTLRPWLARLDAAGTERWRAALPAPGNARGLAALGQGDGSLDVLCALVGKNGGNSRSFVTAVDAAGAPLPRERWLEPGETAQAMTRSADGQLLLAGGRDLPGGNPNLLPRRQALLVKLPAP